MIEELRYMLRAYHPTIRTKMNDSKNKLSIEKDLIIVSQVENLYEIKFGNYIHYTESQDEIIKIIKDNV